MTSARAGVASRRDAEEGSLVAGNLADLVVYTQNFIEGPAAQIADAKVALTLVGGRTVYRAPAGR